MGLKSELCGNWMGEQVNWVKAACVEERPQGNHTRTRTHAHTHTHTRTHTHTHAHTRTPPSLLRRRNGGGGPVLSKPARLLRGWLPEDHRCHHQHARRPLPQPDRAQHRALPRSHRGGPVVRGCNGVPCLAAIRWGWGAVLRRPGNKFLTAASVASLRCVLVTREQSLVRRTC